MSGDVFRSKKKINKKKTKKKKKIYFPDNKIGHSSQIKLTTTMGINRGQFVRCFCVITTG